MIIEDNPISMFLLKECINDRNYSITEVLNQDNIDEVILKYNPNLIILDLIMPQVSGYEILKKYSYIPTIVISSLSCNEAKDKAYKLGCKFFIEKPFDLNYVTNVVQEQLEYTN